MSLRSKYRRRTNSVFSSLQLSSTGKKIIKKQFLKPGWGYVLCSSSLELEEDSDELESKKSIIVTYKLSGTSVVFSTYSDLTLKMLSTEEKLNYAHKRLENLTSRGNCWTWLTWSPVQVSLASPESYI